MVIARVIKGVNKNVIEISDTGNDNFERVLLFIKPESCGSERGLTAQARAYISALRLRRRFYGGNRAAFVATAVISALIGSAITAVFFLLF
jgi:hypothetical protein